MQEAISKLEALIHRVPKILIKLSVEGLEFKPSLIKWSKKEILGHLCDSALNNLQRFTEIQFEVKPYKIRQYNQDNLVIANGYQHMPLTQIMDLWLALNNQIIWIMKLQTKESLTYEIIMGDSEIKTLQWLMTDYVNHLEHHLTQFYKNTY